MNITEINKMLDYLRRIMHPVDGHNFKSDFVSKEDLQKETSQKFWDILSSEIIINAYPEFIEEFKDKMNWKILSRRIVNLHTVERFIDKIDWYSLSNVSKKSISQISR